MSPKIEFSTENFFQIFCTEISPQTFCNEISTDSKTKRSKIFCTRLTKIFSRPKVLLPKNGLGIAIGRSVKLLEKFLGTSQKSFETSKKRFFFSQNA